MSPLAIGEQLGSIFVIEREIARGGMGVVYAARDTRHGRRVAVKVLSREAGAGIGRDRFEREIAVIAQLNHPNILALFDSGEHREFLYFVMPLAEGESLRDRLRRGAPLPVDEAVRLAREIAEALDFAHAEGVIHRDVKPENVLLQQGHALVADFGVAHWQTAGGGTLTATGMSVGTPAYMSPEQASGNRDIDGRSDIYSLGCVVFEMLTGSPPYSADSAGALIVQHLIAAVPSLRDRRQTLSAAMDRAVQRALAKDPADRFATAREFARELRMAAGTVSAHTEATRSLLVLPFADVGSDADTEYFADGLTDELISVLGTVKALRVISRTSAMRLKGADRSLAELAREVKVRYVIEGSVRRHDTRLRITARLVDTKDESTVWTERFSGSLDDVFALQEQLASQIAEALEIALTPNEHRRLARRPTTTTAAYDYYLRAKQESLAFSLPATERALALLDHALKLNGPDELLYGAKGMITVWALDMGVYTDPSALDAADQFAERAFALAADSVMGHVTRGAVHIKRGEMISAAHHLRRALVLDPGNADATGWLGLLYASCGCFDRAQPLMDRAVELDPLTPTAQCFPGVVAWFDGRPHDALPPYERWYAMDPRSVYARVCLASLLLSSGDTSRALRMFDEAENDPAAGIWGAVGTFFGAAVRQDWARANSALTNEVVAFAQAAPEFATWFAWGFALLGDLNRSVEWMGLAAARGMYADQWVVCSLPVGHGLSNHPGYAAVIADMRRRRAAFVASLANEPGP